MSRKSHKFNGGPVNWLQHRDPEVGPIDITGTQPPDPSSFPTHGYQNWHGTALGPNTGRDWIEPDDDGLDPGTQNDQGPRLNYDGDDTDTGDDDSNEIGGDLPNGGVTVPGVGYIRTDTGAIAGPGIHGWISNGTFDSPVTEMGCNIGDWGPHAPSSGSGDGLAYDGGVVLGDDGNLYTSDGQYIGPADDFAYGTDNDFPGMTIHGGLWSSIVNFFTGGGDGGPSGSDNGTGSLSTNGNQGGLSDSGDDPTCGQVLGNPDLQQQNPTGAFVCELFGFGSDTTHQTGTEATVLDLIKWRKKIEPSDTHDGKGSMAGGRNRRSRSGGGLRGLQATNSQDMFGSDFGTDSWLHASGIHAGGDDHHTPTGATPYGWMHTEHPISDWYEVWQQIKTEQRFVGEVVRNGGDIKQCGEVLKDLNRWSDMIKQVGDGRTTPEAVAEIELEFDARNFFTGNGEVNPTGVKNLVHGSLRTDIKQILLNGGRLTGYTDDLPPQYDPQWETPDFSNEYDAAVEDLPELPTDEVPTEEVAAPDTGPVKGTGGGGGGGGGGGKNFTSEIDTNPFAGPRGLSGTVAAGEGPHTPPPGEGSHLNPMVDAVVLLGSLVPADVSKWKSEVYDDWTGQNDPTDPNPSGIFPLCPGMPPLDSTFIGTGGVRGSVPCSTYFPNYFEPPHNLGDMTAHLAGLAVAADPPRSDYNSNPTSDLTIYEDYVLCMAAVDWLADIHLNRAGRHSGIRSRYVNALRALVNAQFRLIDAMERYQGAIAAAAPQHEKDRIGCEVVNAHKESFTAKRVWRYCRERAVAVGLKL